MTQRCLLCPKPLGKGHVSFAHNSDPSKGAAHLECANAQRSAEEITRSNPPRKGVSATKPDKTRCSHGYDGLWSRWEWREDRGETEETSEPVVLAVPALCHECNCADAFCRRCHSD
jgi:hypothetical protein